MNNKNKKTTQYEVKVKPLLWYPLNDNNIPVTCSVFLLINQLID